MAIIFENDGEGVCFILDGLDEYFFQNKEKSVILKLLNRKLLPRSMIIVFSRPSATELIQNGIIIKHIEVFGFSKEQLSEYIDNFPFEDEYDKNCSSIIRANQLKEYLYSHPNIHDMCYLPIHAAMICFLLQSSKKILPTQTKVYEEFALSIIYRHCPCQQVPELLKDLKGENAQYFKDLCHLAYQMTIKSKQVISSQELKDQLGGRSSFNEEAGLGLLTICPTFLKTGIHQNYAFLHLTFQEFLAAYYIANHMEDSQQIQLLEKYSDHMKGVWLFYSGLVKQSKQIFHLFNNQYKYNLFHCAFESQQPYICNELIKYMSQELKFHDELKPTDLLAVEYVITTCSEPITHLDVDHIKSNTITSLLQQIVRADLHQLQYISIGTSGCYFHEDMCNKETDVLCAIIEKSINLKSLRLSIEHTQSSSASKLANQINHCNKLSHLSVSYIGDPECTQTFVSSVSVHNIPQVSLSFIPSDVQRFRPLYGYLQCLLPSNLELTISNTYINEESIHDGLSSITSLSIDLHSHYAHCGLTCVSQILSSKQLESSNYNISLLDKSSSLVDSAIALAGEFKLMTSLKKLCLWESDISPEGAAALASGFKFLTALQKLSLDYSHIGPDGATALADGLKFLTSLQKFNLASSDIGSDGATALAGELKFLTALQELDLSHNNIGPNGATALASGLKFLPALQKLNLSDNNIGPDGATALASGLKFLPALQKLNLSDNNIGPDGATALASGLKFLTALQELDISHNNIGPDGAAALAGELKFLTTMVYGSNIGSLCHYSS